MIAPRLSGSVCRFPKGAPATLYFTKEKKVTTDRNEKYYKALELDKILGFLSNCAALADAKTAALNLKPSSDKQTVAERLSETDEAYKLTASFGSPSFGGAVNVGRALTRAATGAPLSMKELLDIAETLRVIRSVKDWKSHSNLSGGDSLGGLFEALTPCKFLEQKIFSSIKNEEEMFDEASPELSRIRRKLRQNAENVRSRLEKLIKGSASSKYLQDSIITRRDGRFVIPVKVEYRAKVDGLVHDTSGSGSTVFVEPMAVVEVNNEIKLLRSKEADEIERILAELSSDAASVKDTILDSYDALVKLSLIFAKADLAFKMKASLPKINDKGRVYLKNARHPLISARSVVPVTVSLGVDFDTLVITGPNTGGKTVTIKTIGLLSLMTMCGLMIPADDGSEVAVFDNVLADIGDEQSIEQSLSTFSAHMTNIILILNSADGNSLVLIDELGSGTDPIEGAALATAVLMKLREKGAKIAATTHYAELKSYALNTDGVCNAACEFDVETLSPTYRLIIGTPGRSNAFAISARLGLSADIIENAKSMVSEDALKFEEIAAELDRARAEAEKELKKSAKLRMELEEAKAKNKQRTDDINRSRERILENARENARAVVEKARQQADEMLEELKKIRAESNESADSRITRARAAMKSGIRKLEDTADPVVKRQNGGSLPRPLKEGDEVEIIDLDKKATVLEIYPKSEQALVLAGIIKTKVPFSNLRLSEQKKVQIPKTRTVSTNINRVDRKAAVEVDLRGMSSEEAIYDLDRFIDNAIITKVKLISIIHGKGTGVLRKAVQDHLKRHPYVASFRLGVYGEGESGVTIAELK